MSGAFWKLVKKDLVLFLKDRRALLVSVAVPLAVAALMGYVFSRGGGDAHIKVLWVDQDQSAASKAIREGLAEDASVELSDATRDEAHALVLKGKVPVALVVPQGFGEQAEQGFFSGGDDKPTIEVLFDPSSSAERSMVEGMLTQHVMQTISQRVFSAQTGPKVIDTQLAALDRTDGMDPTRKAALESLLGSVKNFQLTSAAKGDDEAPGAMGGLQVPYRTRAQEVVSGENGKYNGYAHSFGGMGVQFVLFTGIELGVGILNERQRGLWRRFRAAPLSRWTLLWARVVAGAIIASSIFALLILASVVLFGVRITGSLPGLALVLLAFGAMTATFGLLVAALAKTPQAARGLSVFAVLVMVMLGGAWIPAFLFPPTLQKLTLIMPTRWAVDAVDAMTWRGQGFGVALAAAGVLAAFSVVFGAVGAWRFRWSE